MTTVFGLKYPKMNSGVLVADRQSTVLDDNGSPTGKELGRKLWKAEDNSFCFGHSGRRDLRLEEFAYNLAQGKYDIEKVISKGYFPELRNLNVKRMGREVPDLNQISGLVMLTRLNSEPHLYACYPLGKVQEMAWSTMGSGQQKVTEYMNAKRVEWESRDYLEEEGIPDLQDTIQIGLEAVRRAQSQDLYSHGLDMVVVTPRRIKDHYNDLGDNFGKTLKSIQNKYKTK
jgi:hypothetical protein